MWWSFAISISFVAGIVVSSLLWNRDAKRKSSNLPRPDGGLMLPFEKSEAILTEGELKLQKQLMWCVGDDIIVFAKTRVLDMVKVPKKMERREFYNNLARTRCVDFVLCDSKNVAPVMVILCGSPSAKKRAEEDVDDVREDILNAANIPFMYLSPNKVYPPSELKSQIRNAITRKIAESHAAVTESAYDDITI